MKAAEAILECLKEHGVSVMFGYPGGAVLPFYDALYDAPIRHILVRHESGASFAADGYAKATGKVGVCVATSGPGATNLVTGIASAYMDSVPLVAITGQVVTPVIGTDAFQEADITGITLPITKHNYLVKDAREIVEIFRQAFYIASTGRRGPVLVDIPRNIFQEDVEYSSSTSSLPGYKPVVKGHKGQIRRAAELIEKSERPLILAGGGVIWAEASQELYEFATRMKIPVATTLMGKGCFPETHQLSLGMVGMHGTKYANKAVCESDLIVAIGMRFDDRVTGNLKTFAPKAKIIHIDIDPAEIGKNVTPAIPIVGDAKNVLQELLNLVGERRENEWNETVERWKRENPLFYKDDGRMIKPQYVVEQIYEECPDAIIATEVGQCQMWAAQFFKFTQPRTLITSGGLGAMGYGIPAAIGAKVGRPEKHVIDIAGDGSVLMSCQQIAVAVDEKIPIKIAVLDNRYLGMVRQWQEIFYGGRYSYTSFMESKTDFVKLAESFGADGILVERKDDVRDAIKEALRINNAVLIDFRVDPMEKVSPMVPPGGSLDQMLDLVG